MGLAGRAEITGFIYGLLDPRDGTLRYVGQTIHLKGRLSQHINDCNGRTPKSRWAARLKKLRLVPEMVILTVCRFHDTDQEEIAAIAALRHGEIPLLNIDSGGSEWKRHIQFRDEAAANRARQATDPPEQDDDCGDGFPPTAQWTDDDYFRYEAEELNRIEGGNFWTPAMMRRRMELDLAEGMKS